MVEPVEELFRTQRNCLDRNKVEPYVGEKSWLCHMLTT